MQKIRNRRRLGRIIDKLLNIAFWIVMIYALTQIANTIKILGDVQTSYSPRGSSVTTQVFLPEDYSEEAYQAALQRYNIEHGYILPGEKTEK